MASSHQTLQLEEDIETGIDSQVTRTKKKNIEHKVFSQKLKLLFPTTTNTINGRGSLPLVIPILKSRTHPWQWHDAVITIILILPCQLLGVPVAYMSTTGVPENNYAM